MAEVADSQTDRCRTLLFGDEDHVPFDIDTYPYTGEHSLNATNPLQLKKGCEVKQHCLFFKDSDMANLQLATDSKGFPTFEDFRVPWTPKTGKEILDNAAWLFDDQSYMHIWGVGHYVGTGAIGSYRAVPHPNVSAEMYFHLKN